MAFFQLFPNATSLSVAEGNSSYSSYNGMLFDTAQTNLLLIPEGMEGNAVLPNTLTSVPACVFSRCTKLFSVTVEGGTANSAFTSVDGILYTQDKTTLIAAPAGVGASVIIAPECTHIAAGAFWGNDSLRTIIAKGSVESIATVQYANAQDGSQVITTYPSFSSEATANAKVALSEDAAREPWEAAGFTEFVEQAQPGAEQKPAEGESGWVLTLLPDYTLSVAWQSSSDGTPETLDVPASAELNGISYTVSALADGAFADAAELRSVNIAQTITSIGSSAFRGCTNLQELSIPRSVKEIGSYAFAETNISRIVLPAGQVALADHLFDRVNGMNVVALESISDISSDVLEGARGISVYVPYEEDGEYAWPQTVIVNENRIRPYALSIDNDVVLKVGEELNLFATGSVVVPPAVAVGYSYDARNVSVSTDGVVTGERAGSAAIGVSLTLGDLVLASTTVHAEVSAAEQDTQEDAQADMPALMALDAAAGAARAVTPYDPYEGAKGLAYAIFEGDTLYFERATDAESAAAKQFLSGNVYGDSAVVYSDVNIERLRATSPDVIPWNNVRGQVKNVVFSDTVVPSSCDYWFSDMASLVAVEDSENLIIGFTGSAINMFSGCTSLEAISLFVGNNEESYINFQSAFNGCSALKSANIAKSPYAGSRTDIYSMENMFKGCTSLADVNMPEVNLGGRSNNACEAFSGCTSLQDINLIIRSEFNIFASRMFSDCTSLQNADLTLDSYSYSGEGLDNQNMFSGCTSLQTVDLELNGSWIENQNMFSGCAALQSANLVLASSSCDFQNTFSECNLLKNATIAISNSKACQVFMEEMFFKCSALEWVTFEAANGFEVNGMARMFSGCTALTNATFPEALYSENSIDLSYMFNECSALLSAGLPFSYLDGTTDASYMFNGCTALKDVSISLTYHEYGGTSTNPSRLITKSMFSGCLALNSLNLSTIEPTFITDASYMFSDCSSLATLVLSDKFFDYATDMSHMFAGCSSLSKLSKIYINGSPNTSYMFSGCSALPGLDLSECYIYTPDARYMFSGCSSLAYITLPEADSGYVFSGNTDCSYEGMFNGCSSLVALDFGGKDFDTTNVTDMSNMFYGCSSLTSLDLRGFNTANVTDMSNMFYGCSSLKALDLINDYGDRNRGFTAAKVTNMSSMFEGCRSLVQLNLVLFSTTLVTDMSNMFNGCTGLHKIQVGLGNTYWNTNAVRSSANMFTGCVNIEGDRGTRYSSSHTDVLYARIDDAEPGYLTSMDRAHAILCTDGTMKFMRGSYDSNLKKFVVYNKNNNAVEPLIFLDNLDYPIERVFGPDAGDEDFERNVLSEVEIPWYDVRDKVYVLDFYLTMSPVSLAYWFKDFIQLSEVIDLSRINMSNVISMESMFEGCTNLVDATEFGKFDSSMNNLVRTDRMFADCSKLVECHIGFLNTPSIISMDEMFKNCARLEYFAYQNTSSSYPKVSLTMPNATSMSSMFEGCAVLEQDFLYYCKDISNVTDMSCLYKNSGLYDSSLPSTLNSVEDMSSMYEGCAYLEGVNIPADVVMTGSLITTCNMFNGCSMLYNLDLTNFDTSNVTDMSSMFKGCTTLGVESDGSVDDSDALKLVAYDRTSKTWSAGKFNTSKVSNMSSMFEGCSSLYTLDLLYFDTSNVTDMSSMFKGCLRLWRLELLNFDTSIVSNMQDMFSGCSSVKSILVGSGWTTRYLDTEQDMFSGCKNLIGGNGTKYDAANVKSNRACIDEGPGTSSPGYLTDYGYAYCYLATNDNGQLVLTFDRGCCFPYKNRFVSIRGNIETMSYPICGPDCITPEDYDPNYDPFILSDIEKTNYGAYFSVNEDPSDYSYYQVEFDASTIPWCGQRYSLIEFKEKISPIDLTCWFAGSRVEEVLNAENLDTSRVTSMGGMFMDSTYLKSLDLSNWDTENVTDMRAMFSGCSALTSLDLTGFDTVNVQDMYGMFNSCTALTKLDLLDFDTSVVTNTAFMFNNCRALSELELTSFDTSAVTNMVSMFCGCQGLTSLDLSSFDTSKVTNIYSMFYRCTSLKTIYASERWDITHDRVNAMAAIDEDRIGYVFYNSTSLVGGNGTTYNRSYTDAHYAHVDVPGDSGYMTYREAPPLSYRVIFKSNGGTAVPFQKVVEGNKALKPDDPAKEGYIFTGWYSDPELTTEWDFDTPITKRTTLYAKWVRAKYQVTFNTNGGGNIDSQTVEYEGKVKRPADPVKQGYTLSGWFKDPGFTRMWNFGKDIVTADITLYAKWDLQVVVTAPSQIMFTIQRDKFDTENNDEAVTIEKGSIESRTAEPIYLSSVTGDVSEKKTAGGAYVWHDLFPAITTPLNLRHTLAGADKMLFTLKPVGAAANSSLELILDAQAVTPEASNKEAFKIGANSSLPLEYHLDVGYGVQQILKNADDKSMGEFAQFTYTVSVK